MQVHLNAAQTVQAQEGELSLNFIKKYIGYCRKYVIFICSALINFKVLANKGRKWSDLYFLQ